MNENPEMPPVPPENPSETKPEGLPVVQGTEPTGLISPVKEPENTRVLATKQTPPETQQTLLENTEAKEGRIHEVAPNLWKTPNALRKILGINIETVQKTAEKYRQSKPGWFEDYIPIRNDKKTGGLACEHYSPELVATVTKELSEREGPPNSKWRTNQSIAEELQVANKTVQGIVSQFRQTKASWFRTYLHPAGKMTEFYAPKLVRIIEKAISQRKPARPKWKTCPDLSRMLERHPSPATIRKIAEEYRKSNPEWFREYTLSQQPGRLVEHYSPKLVRIITERITAELAPTLWRTMFQVSKDLGISYDLERKIVEPYRKKNPEWFKNLLSNPKSGKKGRVTEHLSPELVKIIGDEVNVRKARENAEEEAFMRSGELRQKLEVFSKDVVEGTTLESQEFRKLLNVFGSSHLFDILYKFRPEFRNIPPDYVKGTLAKYLGDFLVIQNQFRVEDVRPALQFLSEQSFQDSLFEVVKADCLARYQRLHSADPASPNAEIIGQCIASVRDEGRSLNSPDFERVVERVERYYDSLLADFKKSERVIETLKPERLFPDINQSVNIKELSDKKRLLIADEMGLGKSASVILAKEYLGVKCAAVVVPSNVLATWQNYLSDEVSETGEQIGYFKQGKAPKVLVVDRIENIQNADPPPSEYDYILISQERMNERYVNELKKCGIDALFIDEVHKLKNVMRGKRAQSVLELAKAVEGEGKYLALLSGTPVPNKVQDIAMVLKLLYPERFGEITDRELVASIIHGDIVDMRNLLTARMQMKTLRESIELPELREETMTTTLTKKEQDIYEILLDDDELTADQKIKMFRKYVMNPRSVDPTPDIEGSKIKEVGAHLREVFNTRRKVVMFVNGYVEGMIRGEDAFIRKFELPADVRVRVIDGTTSRAERLAIQKEFKQTTEKILLVVSGQTADVGVDFSPVEEMLVYNDPWTEYDKRQQIARGYRPGLANDLTVTTSVVEGTIEEGIQEYIRLKYTAIQKILKGIPITEIEQQILEMAEKQKVPEVEGDVAIAREWLNSPQNRLHRFFGITKEIGEKNFHTFLLEHGEEYADCYADMGSRGFQANTGRVVGTLIDQFSRESGKKSEEVKILDIASGPEMLKTHIGDAYQKAVISLDINPLHFKEEGGRRVAGSFLRLPFQEKSVDYANLSLAFHYTRFIPRRKEYERLTVLSEMNRVLKTGGRAVINLIHSLRFKDEDKFKAVAAACGFKVVPDYTGTLSSGEHYRSYFAVLEKEHDVGGNLEDVVKEIGPENLDGLKFRENVASSLRNARRIVSRFSIENREVPVVFNDADEETYEEEQAILREGKELIGTYGAIKAIPKEQIISKGFLRIFNGKSYRLLKKSEKMSGFVDIR